MTKLNRLLTYLAIIVLSITISILFWMRGRALKELEQSVENTVLRFDAQNILHDPRDSDVVFKRAEERVERAKSNPYIKDLVVTKILEGKGEFPVAPYDSLALYGPQWIERYRDWRREPLQAGQRTLGRLYFQLDHSSVLSVNLAIGAATIALAATLLILLGRVYSQESSLVRVGGELEERRRELIRLERLALAGQLSAGLLHDLKKPVLNIRHATEDLKQALGDFAGASPALTATREQVDLFFQMLNNSEIERFVRSDRVREEYVDLNEIMRKSLALVHYERGSIQIRELYAEAPPPVLARPYRLVQVFSNLILNAYQAMDGRGRIEIQTRATNGGVEARITDDGPGIDPGDLDSVFDPFFTTKAEADGSGLGLAICRMIVEELGGRIEVESRSGGPTTFRVLLPSDKNA